MASYPSWIPSALAGFLRSRWTMRVPRRVALLGGTTTTADCCVALHYMISPWQLVRGPVIPRYEDAFARRIGLRYAYSFATGRVALYGVLRGLGIGPGDEVLLQVPTHIVVANAVHYAGAKPVFVDCCLGTYNMDFDLAEKKVTPRTRAIIVQHTFGIPADLDVALALARKHGLDLIEDCVHALGATYDGRPVGSFGRAAFFSTEETKTISSTMGGMAVTDDPDLAAYLQSFQASCTWPSSFLVLRYLIKLLAYHALTEPHIHVWARKLYELVGRRHPLPMATVAAERLGQQGAKPSGYERRLSNAQAAMAIRQLERLDDNIAHRRSVAGAYQTLLSHHAFASPRIPPKANPSLVRYPVWVKDRTAARKQVGRHTVLGTWFTSTLEEAVSPAHGGYEVGSCPNAEAIANHLVNLPTHGRVSPPDIEAIVGALAEGSESRERRQPAAVKASHTRPYRRPE